MEERQFLHRLCSLALNVDVAIEFAGIIDSDGKLLVGKSKNTFNEQYLRYSINTLTKKESFTESYEKGLFKDKSLTSGYMGNIVSLQANLIDKVSFFQLINLYNDIFLAYIPINDRYDKFLYVYFKRNHDLEGILLKLDSTF